ncbi:MAG: (2Fe-2S) ferredoxin domain-containing protein [Alphaproteobacteria bacterium]|nr:(2Fe-2S) ferredoxin domain-containing protein [Alphaproteobacteria bacterium]
MSDTEFSKQNHYFVNHVFCCENKRDKDAPRGSCKASGGAKVRDYMKSRCKKLKLPATRINSSGCLDRCEMGPVLVVYPQGIWYHCPTKEDAEEIIQEHLINGRIVERLRLGARQKRLEQKK